MGSPTIKIPLFCVHCGVPLGDHIWDVEKRGPDHPAEKFGHCSEHLDLKWEGAKCLVFCARNGLPTVECVDKFLGRVRDGKEEDE